MKLFKYIIPLLLLSFVSCRDFHVHFFGDSVLAEVDGKQLMNSEVSSVIPKEYHGEDSLIFAETYIDKWIRKQVKLRKAETTFLTSEADIESLVEEYRQLLLIKKLDESFVSSSVDTTYTDEQISAYYQQHTQDLRLNRDVIRGEVLRIPLESNQIKTLEELMSSSSEAKREDMLSICEKNGFEYTDLSKSWTNAESMLDLLPLVRGAESEKLLSQSGVNHMKDENFDYYYQIFEYKKAGDIAPLEWVRSIIRTILTTERQQNLIRKKEDELYKEAVLEGVIKRQYIENKEKEEKQTQEEELS
ncbi:MAG: hypothetical protein R3Y08_00885 [Rikenellaceae bacterium]